MACRSYCELAFAPASAALVLEAASDNSSASPKPRDDVAAYWPGDSSPFVAFHWAYSDQTEAG